MDQRWIHESKGETRAFDSWYGPSRSFGDRSALPFAPSAADGIVNPVGLKMRALRGIEPDRLLNEEVEHAVPGPGGRIGPCGWL